VRAAVTSTSREFIVTIAEPQGLLVMCLRPVCDC